MTSLAHRIGARRGVSLASLRAGLAALALAAVAGGCEGRFLTDSVPVVQAVIAGVAVNNGPTASLRTGAAPFTADGATFTVSAPPAAVVGGTALYTLSSGTPFQKAVVTVDGYEGFYEVDLPAPVTTVDLLVTFQQEQLYFVYNLFFNGTPPGDAAGKGAVAQTRLISVGTGDVQVSVFFDALSDVDLYVTDPSNEVIYFANSQGVNGELDLDANAGCGINDPVVNNENVTFPTGQAPRGTYIVRLDYWSSCNVAKTRYVVTVAVKGRQPEIFTGEFTGTGTRGSAPVEITRFTY